jgi:hypothetical protein
MDSDLEQKSEQISLTTARFDAQQQLLVDIIYRVSSHTRRIL